MAEKTARKSYVKPIVQKLHRLAHISEGTNIVVSGTVGIKGGCFSNNR